MLVLVWRAMGSPTPCLVKLHMGARSPIPMLVKGWEVTRTHVSMGQSQPEVTPKSAQSRPEVGPRSAQSRPKVGPKLAQSRPKVRPKSAQSRPKVGPKSVQSQPKVSPKSGPSRLGIQWVTRVVQDPSTNVDTEGIQGPPDPDPSSGYRGCPGCLQGLVIGALCIQSPGYKGYRLTLGPLCIQGYTEGDVPNQEACETGSK